MKLGIHRGFFDVLEGRLGARFAAELRSDAATLEDILIEPEEGLRDLRFRRMADRMATWVMLGGMHPISSLVSAVEVSRRHLVDIPVDDDYLGWIQDLAR